MKKIILALSLLALSSSAFADGACYLQTVGSDGSFGEYILKKEGVTVDETAPVSIASKDGQYSINIRKMTQANLEVNLLKGGKLLLQTMTVGINSRFQWVRSTVMNSDDTGVSLWCTFSNSSK